MEKLPSQELEEAIICESCGLIVKHICRHCDLCDECCECFSDEAT